MPDIDWENLGFRYLPTAGHIHCTWKDGRWSEVRIVEKPTVEFSVAAGALHYGQACFEGGKAFRQKDGSIKLFRPEANAARLNSTLRYLVMPEIPEEMYLEAVRKLVAFNADYVPPMESNGAFYLRPMVFASGAQLGLGPCDQYEFIMFGVPVGGYYKGGLRAVDAIIFDDYDRAPTFGTGHVKAAGNYAASIFACEKAKKMGFPAVLYLDAATHTKIEEFSSSNFLAVTRDGTYVTPRSRSILPSITNDSLQQLARHLGMTVEVRPVEVTELADFAEVASCGTAVVITPISKIVHGNITYAYGENCGPVFQKLYDAFRAIQNGVEPDIFNWLKGL